MVLVLWHQVRISGLPWSADFATLLLLNQSKWESAWMRSFQSSSCWLSPMSKRPQKSKGREKQKNYLFLKLYKKGEVNSLGRYIQTLAIHKLRCLGVVVVPMTRSDVLVLVLCLLKVVGEH